MLIGFNAKIIKLPENEDLTFPREMFVTNRPNLSIVDHKFKHEMIPTIILWRNSDINAIHKYVGVHHEDIQKYKNGQIYRTVFWRFAEEIPEKSSEKELLLDKAEELITKANELKEMASKLK